MSMPRLSRRRFVQGTALAGATLLSPLSPIARTGTALAAEADGPRTGFEQRGGASWTTHDEELDFLAQVAEQRPDRVHLEVIGETNEERPLHLVTLGAPVIGNAAALTVPTVWFVCSQHGNEPAGREAGLQLLRDLAFTDDAALTDQMSRQAILFLPSANPDGRARNTRGNSRKTDINRDHLNLVTEEARAMAAVMKAWAPSLVLDLHEYGPGTPVLYDDEILFLWPRNLNVDGAVRDNARSFCFEYIKKDAERAGYTADVYGLNKVGPNVGPLTVDGLDIEVNQTAGDEDEGISRNAMGLRHAFGILIESAVTQNPYNGPGDEGTPAGNQLRRVASHGVASHAALRFMREQGDAAKLITDTSPIRKAREGAERSAPVYFGGADNKEPTATQIQDPPPSRYRITAEESALLTDVFALHGIATEPDPEVPGATSVPMGQHAEPVIPLLLDARGRRHAPGVSGEPID